jgi:hypothetical protein
MLLGVCLSAPLLLAGCGGDQGVPQNFPPLRYSYLAPLSLNVTSIQTQVAYAPSDDGSSLDAMSPEAPIQAVEQMLQDRLVAAGTGSTGGTATVTINTASLNRVNDTAVGNISVQVAVISADGRRSGYTQASVTRTRTLPDDTSDDALRAFLYQMTSDLVNAENVELEYQIRQHLAGWLVGGSSPIVGGPAAPTPVQSEPLSGPGAPVLSAPALGAPMPLGAPAPASMSVPAAVPPAGLGAPSTLPPMPMSMPITPPQGQPPVGDTTPTMPSGDLGLPQGNPLPQEVTPPTTPVPSGGPVSLTPPAPADAPTGGSAPAYQLVPSSPPASSAPAAPPPAAPPAPTAPANPAALPPLPPTITP